MDVLSAVLAFSLLVAATALSVYVRRVRALERERSAAVAASVAATGRPVRSIAAGLEHLVARLESAERQEAMIRAAVEQAAAGIAVLDPQFEVLFATTSARQMLEGRHGDAAASLRIRDLARAAFVTGRPVADRVELYVPNRRVLAVRVNRLPPDVVDGVIVEVGDITHEERVGAIRRDFIANASHELKTPVGALTVLAEAIGETDDQIARKRLSTRLVGEAERLAALVDDILDLSLVERGQPVGVVVDLVEVVEEACRRTAVVAEQSRAKVRAEVPDERVVVRGDRRQLVSAVANLLDNAIKYGAAADATGPQVEVRVWGDAHDAVIAIEDHGVGISEQHRARIFERFYRVDRARSRGRGGTGLGLAIVRHVALNHGGDVTVDSTPGVGSVFRLRLPRAEA